MYEYDIVGLNRSFLRKHIEYDEIRGQMVNTWITKTKQCNSEKKYQNIYFKQINV